MLPLNLLIRGAHVVTGSVVLFSGLFSGNMVSCENINREECSFAINKQLKGLFMCMVGEPQCIVMVTLSSPGTCARNKVVMFHWEV